MRVGRIRRCSGERSRKGSGEPALRLGEFFRQDAGFADGGEEVGVSGPAGKDVEVEMGGDAGTGSRADIQAGVDTVGTVDVLEAGFGEGGEFDEFGAFGGRESVESSGMPVRHHHQVAVIVGIAV
jgi:hypothetical protein